jgi:leucyl aminopeptidase (aminopeptidase T)
MEAIAFWGEDGTVIAIVAGENSEELLDIFDTPENRELLAEMSGVEIDSTSEGFLDEFVDL